MLKQTPLHELHQSLGAKMVDFGGWHMPLHYGSQVEEHHQVRQDAGFFDVSHMGVVDIVGADAKAYLQYLLANDVAKLTQNGKALYSCMLNEQGGVIDDLIVYYLDQNHYRLVINAATKIADVAWMQQQRKDFNCTITLQDHVSIIAVQGPHALSRLMAIFPDWQTIVDRLSVFQATDVPGINSPWLLAKTGYTGEAGCEIILPADEVVDFAQTLLTANIAPIGLGARDTLRLEAGMALSGQDMDSQTQPAAAGLSWTVDLKDTQRNFIGKTAITQTPAPNKQIAVVLTEKGVLRHGQTVMDAQGYQGTLTSGSFSPTLKVAIGLARVPAEFDSDSAQVHIRQKALPLTVVKAPFVRHGQAQIDL